MKFNIIKKNERVTVLSNNYYELSIINIECYKSYKINTHSEKLPNTFVKLPDIFIEQNLDTGKIENITIETFSIGCVKKENMEKFINNYSIALETVKELEKILY